METGLVDPLFPCRLLPHPYVLGPERSGDQALALGNIGGLAGAVVVPYGFSRSVDAGPAALSQPVDAALDLAD